MAPSKMRPHAGPSTHRIIVDAYRQRENELKRSRGEISCAECRRSKLRCDRKIPCFTCVRRGCESICPSGVLSGGQPTKFGPQDLEIIETRILLKIPHNSSVLADTEELHLKLVEMSDRIRSLEDALEASAGPHPILCNDLRAVKYIVGHNFESVEKIPRHIHDPLVLSGALKITDDGESRFLGPTTGSEAILLSEVASDKHEEGESPQSEVPLRLYEFARMWPFTPIDLPKEDIRIIIEAQLPTWERASALCESYLGNVGWYATPVDRQQLVEELLPSIYKRPNQNHSQREGGTSIFTTPYNHDLALLLIVFACGAAGDHTQEPKNDEGQHFYDLSRVALGLQPIFESASLSTVQALTLMAVYDSVAIRKNDLEESWRILYMAAVIAGSIGLHRDPGRWKLHPKVVERRRNAFWEMYFLCNLQCLAGGRPPPFVASAVDVQLPQDSDVIISASGKSILSCRTWRLHLLKECIAPIADRLCADCTPLKYYEILNFDKKICSFDEIRVWCREISNERVGSLPLNVRILCYKSILRSYLHRNFFAKAISNSLTSPQQPPYGFSFMTLLNNAVSFLDTFNEMRSDISGSIIRYWAFVAHALECAFVVGTVPVRCPRTSHVAPAIRSLEIAIDLFNCTKQPIAKKGLPILLRFREKAKQATYMSHVVPSSNNLSSSSISAVGDKEGEGLDELGILRGASRLVVHSSDRSAGPSGRTSLPASSSSGTTCGTISQPELLSFRGVLDSGVQSQLEPPVVASEQTQADYAGTLFTTDAFNWSELYNQASDQLGLPIDFAMSDGVDDQMFANLVPDAFFNPSG